MSREALAVAAGVVAKTIERIEYNVRDDARVETLLGLSRALRVSVDYLLTGDHRRFADTIPPGQA